MGSERLPGPSLSRPPGPGRGRRGSGGGDCRDPPPRLPRPHPYLRAASPIARSARSCGSGGRWGPSSCGVSCPWCVREPARAPKCGPASPAAGPAAPGGRQRDARAATAGAPSPSPATPPNAAANGHAGGGTAGGAEPGGRLARSTPPRDRGDLPSHPALSAPGRVRRVQVGWAGCGISQPSGLPLWEDCSRMERTRGRTPAAAGPTGYHPVSVTCFCIPLS